MAGPSPSENPILAKKREVRRLLRQRLAPLSPEQRHAHSLAIAQRLGELPEWRNARTLLLYLALPDEVETAALFEAAFADGKRVAVPKIIDPAQRLMVPVPIRSLAAEELAQAHYGVRVPVGETEALAIESIDFAVIPGLGFSRRGQRIGRGMGYYDRFLAQPEFRGARCGLGFEAQVLEELPSDEHDRPVDMLVTEVEVLRF